MTQSSTTERTLIDLLQTGDGRAVEALASAYGPKVYQLAFRYMKNREDAEEVAQDVLMKVVQKIHAFRGDSALSSWIYRITFNTAMSRLRTARFVRSAEISAQDIGSRDNEEGTHRPFDPADWSSLADEAVMRRELRERFAEAMETLPEIYRTPIELRDIHGLSTQEASRVLQVKTQTLKSRLHRGRLILRERLADFSDGLALRPAA